MKNILIAVFCCVSYAVTTQAPNTISTLAPVPPSQSNWEEFASSHQSSKEATKANKDKFSCVLNLLKNALTEELENSQCQITEEATQESVITSINSILEEEQMKKETEEGNEEQGVQNEINADKALYQKIIKKIASAFSKPQNVTSNPNLSEMPTMIPIFKPRPTAPRNELNQKTDFSPTPIKNKQIPKSRPVSFVPEKIIQTNMNPIPTQAMFNIPYQRAADVLDMTNNAIPKESICADVSAKRIVKPVVEAPKSNLPTHLTAPVTLSVNCADSDDTVALLFKPKNISLMQLYGNLLKKITITVLVPYHMSKLGGK